MRTFDRLLVSAVVLGSSLGLPLAASAAAFQNGSFELNSDPFRDITSQAQAPTGWIPGGQLGNFNLFSEHTGTFGVVAQDGVAMIGFGGNGQSGATLSQTFDTVVGGSYTVDFYVTAQQLGSGPQSYLAEALGGAAVLGSRSDAISDASFNWVNHSFSFVATSTSTTLRFTDISNGAQAGGINWALDNVSVTTASVPEAGTLGLLGAGLAALAFFGRARRRAE